MEIQLHQLLDALPSYMPHGGEPAYVLVDSICCDSRKVGFRSLFFCLRGSLADGHDYAVAAYRQGARLFVVEHPVDLPADACTFQVLDSRMAMALVAAEFYGHPEREMRLIGLTGTKGKTTTALLIRHALERAGIPTGYIGTNGVDFEEYHYATVNSTPESLEIYRYLRLMLDCGVRTAVMEVSSQALWMRRVLGLTFEAVVFTNLAPDHIGGIEHPSFDHYKACKHTLLTDYGARTIVCNADDPATPDMLRGASGQPIAITTSGTPHAVWSARDIHIDRVDTRIGISFSCICHGKELDGRFFLPLPGVFNVMNALCAVAVACDICGLPPIKALQYLSDAVIPGRFEVITFPTLPNVTFVIDYAHNGVSLAAILHALRDYVTENGRLICLFGSVGGRTKGRRVDLAEAAGQYADLCILTSDNPGSEPPDQIINEIDKAFPAGSCPRECVTDRTEAIVHAVEIARPGDIILLAGKGHEQYQLVGVERLAYSEHDALRYAVNRLKPSSRRTPMWHM